MLFSSTVKLRALRDNSKQCAKNVTVVRSSGPIYRRYGRAVCSIPHHRAGNSDTKLSEKLCNVALYVLPGTYETMLLVNEFSIFSFAHTLTLTRF